MNSQPRFCDELRRELVAASRRRHDELHDATPRRRQMRVRPIAATGLTATAIGGVVAAAVVAAGGGSGVPDAYAGWTATPSAVPNATSDAGVATCVARLAQQPLNPSATSAAPQGAWSQVAVDSRGPFTLAVLQNGDTTAECLTGADGVAAIGMDTPSPAQPPAGLVVVNDSAGDGTVGGGQRSAIEGRVASDVSGVSITLADGSGVQSTVQGGWFVAWWPSSTAAVSATITTTGGTTSTQQLSGS